MRNALLAGLLVVVVLLSACSNNSSAPASEEDVQETVQNFYNEMSKFDQMGKSSLEDFNTTVASYSAGKATDKELEKALEQFQNTASEIADEVKDVKISGSLPEDIQKLLRDSIIAFQSAYSIKEKASESAVSPEVTPEEFNAMNEQADVAMLYGISKLNEAREAVGLIDSEGVAKEVTGAQAESGTSNAPKVQVETSTGTVTGSETGTTVTDVEAGDATE